MKQGKNVRVTTKQGLSFEGTVLPADHLVLKLSDGYNVGIDQRNIKKTEEIASPKKQAEKKALVKKNKDLPLVIILHTGGTIASKVDYDTGGVTNLIEPEEILKMYPELQTIARVEAEFVANMSSDDMRFAHYNIMIRAIQKALKKQPVGIIITQGTDTIHYTAAALHYALQNITIPVVIVGSQRSSDRGSSDAATNLSGVTKFITTLKSPGVYVGLHETTSDDSIAILFGINTRKMHSSRRDAFKPINIPLHARVKKGEVELITEREKPEEKLNITLYDEKLKIGMAYIHPQYHAEELLAYKGFDGLVVLGTGLGHTPINTTDDHAQMHAEIKKALEELTKKLPVVMTTQCINGRVGMQVYSAGRRHVEMGLLGNDSVLTPETTFIKLGWLLSQNKKPEEITTDYGDDIPRSEKTTL